MVSSPAIMFLTQWLTTTVVTVLYKYDVTVLATLRALLIRA